MKITAGLRNAWRHCVPATNKDIHQILMKLTDLAATLTALDTEVQKIGTEVQALKNSLTNVDLPADAQTALDNLTTHLKAVDDLNPDIP